ncbi:hypothetical protein B0H65DRAFT_510181 [Neurospora tetraspora]|uniref:Uncharacterized protein n=1 Tax=Neurospora tetraspora TaxID=94610 RepID=A0AAE0JDP4_9PEZI|nr:hypothetical protein B0H65DRAFT_510181 [Neurospora tetraspora]
MSTHAIERKPVPSSSIEVPPPPPKSEKQVRFAEWTESEGGPSAIPPMIPPIAITSSLRSPSPASLQRPPTPTEYFDIPYPPDTFDPDSDVLDLNIPSTPLSPRPEPHLALPIAPSALAINQIKSNRLQRDAETRARNNHIFAAATSLSIGITQLEVRLGGVDLIPGLRQQASISRLECQAFYNFLSPPDKELFLVEQLPIFAARVSALASRTEECNLRIPCVQVLDTRIGVGGGKHGKETVRWEVGEKDGPPCWRDLALGAEILGWVRRRMRVALWEDLPGGLKGLVERPEGSQHEDEDGEDGEANGKRAEGEEGRRKRIGSKVRKPGFLTLWHEMLRRDDVVLRKKEELVKMMREGILCRSG